MTLLQNNHTANSKVDTEGSQNLQPPYPRTKPRDDSRPLVSRESNSRCTSKGKVDPTVSRRHPFWCLKLTQAHQSATHIQLCQSQKQIQTIGGLHFDRRVGSTVSGANSRQPNTTDLTLLRQQPNDGNNTLGRMGETGRLGSHCSGHRSRRCFPVTTVGLYSGSKYPRKL